MNKILTRCSAVVLIVAWSGIATAASQNFALPGHGSLLLNVPQGWTSNIKQPPGGLPPTIEIGAHGDASFVVLVTAVWGNTPTDTPDDGKIRSIVASAAKSAEAQSVEKSLSLRNFVGSSGSGCYFRATDRAPKPGEWKYLTQGMIRTGAIALTFTILTNDGQASIEKSALEMIRLAAQSGAAAQAKL